MKKTITRIWCDDCGAEVGDNYFSYNSKYFGKEIELCQKCLRERLDHSFEIYEDRQCQTCFGCGNIKVTKDYYESETKQCPACRGRGVCDLGSEANGKRAV